MTKREQLNRVAKEIESYLIAKYGTSEGAMRAWDTKGRGKGNSDPAQKNSKSSKIEREISSGITASLQGVPAKAEEVQQEVMSRANDIFRMMGVNPKNPSEAIRLLTPVFNRVLNQIRLNERIADQMRQL
jgi:hypothetical protein